MISQLSRKGKNKEWQRSEEVEERAEDKGLKLSITGKRRRKEQSDSFVQVLGEGRGGCEGAANEIGGHDRKCGNARGGLGNTNKPVGSEREGEDEKVRFSLFRKIESFKRITYCCLVPARAWGGQAVGITPQRG